MAFCVPFLFFNVSPENIFQKQTFASILNINYEKKYQILDSYKVYAQVPWIHWFFSRVVHLSQWSDYCQEEGYFYQTIYQTMPLLFKNYLLADIIYLQKHWETILQRVSNDKNMSSSFFECYKKTCVLVMALQVWGCWTPSITVTNFFKNILPFTTNTSIFFRKIWTLYYGQLGKSNPSM